MAILFHDGLGQYADATDLARRFTSIPSSTSLLAGPRAGCKEVRSAASALSALRKAVNPSTPTQGIIAGRMGVDLLSSGGSSAALQVVESDGTIHLTVTTGTDGVVAIRRGSYDGTVLAESAAGVVAQAQRYFVELKFTIHETNGFAEVRINEVVVATTGAVPADTRNGGTAGTWSIANWNCCYVAHRWTDLYIADGTDYLGECQTDYHVVNANGATRQWTPSTGTDDFEVINDVPSSSTDYLAATTVGNRYTCGVEALKHTGAAILAVTPLYDIQKMDAGTALIQDVIRHNGTDYLGEQLAPSTTYGYLSPLPKEVNPGTGVAFTESGFNAIEVGAEKVA